MRSSVLAGRPMQGRDGEPILQPRRPPRERPSQRPFQALNEDPQFAEALLNLGHALMAAGQEEEARSCWRKAIREKPELAQMYFEPPTV